MLKMTMYNNLRVKRADIVYIKVIVFQEHSSHGFCRGLKLFETDHDLIEIIFFSIHRNIFIVNDAL